jgi:hypothetical protein
MKGVVLDQPLSYADRFRIRNADKNDKWTFLSPHIDSKNSCVMDTSFTQGRTPDALTPSWLDGTMGGRHDAQVL